MRMWMPAVVAVLGMLWLGLGVGPAAGAPKSAAGTAAARKAGRAQEVSRAALALKKLGLYQGDTSGKWCPELHDALKDFQKGRGLKVTGRLNRETRIALGLEQPKVGATRGEERASGGKAAEAP